MTSARAIKVTTHNVPPHERAQRWTEAIASSYFPLDLTFREPERFSGQLTMRQLGAVGLSRLSSDALSYRRRARHLASPAEDAFLVTIPRTTPVEFAQFGRSVTCSAGGFVIERGNEPYVFRYTSASDLIALKVSRESLAARVSRPETHCAVGFGAREGVGALLVETVLMAEKRIDALPDAAAAALGEHVLNLIALSVDAADGADPAADSDVRAAHLRRIDAVIFQRAADPRLSPQEVAAVCGISVRHLHGLCSSDGPTVGQRIRKARLDRAQEALRSGSAQSITEIALTCGFGDGAQFSRAFRAAFGMSPSDARRCRRTDGC